MSRLAMAYGQAVAAHRQAVQRWENARRALAAAGPVPPSGAELVGRLARLGVDLAPAPGAASLAAAPVPVRVGEATTVDGAFPVLLPLGAGAHLAVDADARDPRVGELLRALIVRLLATAPAGTVRVAGIDPAALGAAFLPLRPLLDAGVLGPPATTAAEVAAVLDDAERHERTARGDRELLLIVAASVPSARELARLAALTHTGPAAGVCVLLAGYPPTGVADAAPPLGAATQLRLNERYALTGDPPGSAFSADGSGLAAAVLLDGDPPVSSIAALAARLAAATRRSQPPAPAAGNAAMDTADGRHAVSTFDEYAALARQLSAQLRGGDQGAAEAERRRALQAAADQLGQRLATQGQRLDELGRSTGAASSASVDAAPLIASPGGQGASRSPAPAGSPVPDAPPPPGASGPVPSLAPVSPPVMTAAPAPADAVGATVGVAQVPQRAARGAGSGGAAAAPGRPGVGAYPQMGETASPFVTGGSATVVPAPRPAEGDPAAELAVARQLADEADRHGQQAEAIALRPPLLPTWSPLARAVVVYVGCALVGAALVLLLAVASAVQMVGLGAALAVACTGVPVASFVAGHLVLGRWGRPALGGGPPPSRFVPLGFVICALLPPSLYCGYVLLFRLLP